MQFRPNLKTLAVCAILSAAALAPVGSALADQGDDAIRARHGYMDLVLWNAGPLFGVAKGKVAYDAAKAEAAAANLEALSHVDYPALFIEGTSTADRPGKTKALPDIWKDNAKFHAAFENFQSAVKNLAAEAGKGQAQLTAAVEELGRACGGCHKPFREKNQ